MNDLTLGTCSFNTPGVTINMLDSFKKYHPECGVIICENSTNEETVALLEGLSYPYLRNKGLTHSEGVDVLLANCPTKYMLLVDTDVIFLQSVAQWYHNVKTFKPVLSGVKQGSRGGLELHDRICPWFCFFDVEVVKKHGFVYYDDQRFKQHLTSCTEKVYDVGATILEDVLKAGLPILEMSEETQNTFIKHFEGMSWRKDCADPGLVELAKKVEEEYNQFVKEN